MSEEEKKSETLAEKHTRLMQERQEKDKAIRTKEMERDCQRMELASKYERELGREGSEFMIFDSKFVDDPLVVLKRPATVQWTKYEQSKMTYADRYDFVAPSVVHPTLDEFNALKEKRAGATISCSNLLSAMMGLRLGEESGK